MTANNDKLKGLLGLSMKAGKLVSGGFKAEESIKKNKAYLCLVATKSSQGTKKKYKDMCAYRGIKFRELSMDMAELGSVIGKGDRAVIVIEDKGFADSINISLGGGSEIE